MSIAVVVPTIRPDSFRQFLEAWRHQFEKHHVTLVAVHDGDPPTLEVDGQPVTFDYPNDLIFNFTDACRNLGFLYVAQCLPEVEYIISLDDDVKPYGDTIGGHLKALQMDVIHRPGWLSTMIDAPPRGLPYSDRSTMPVVLSHGVWSGVADYDGPTQLIRGTEPGTFAAAVVPPGTLFPVCIMNVAFRRCMLPYVYQAPMGPKLVRFGLPTYDRFADIWGGISAKLAADRHGWACVTGYVAVRHERASNVWANIRKESVGLELNESFAGEFADVDTKNKYVLFYRRKLEQWAAACGL